MKVKGPIITLVSGLVLAGALLGLSTAANDNRAATDAAAASAAATASPTSAASTAPPTPAGTAAPGAPPAVPVAQVTFAGALTGAEASIAIAVKDGKAIAYICDGKKLESWLQGTASGGQLSLTGAKQASVTGTYTDGQATGSVTAAGRTWSFRVKSVQKPSGLYRAAATVAGAQVVGGWIVADGRQVGMLDRGGTEVPAPPIDPATGSVTIDGTTVTATPVDGAGN
jgi:serine/threonine-protein kinase